MTKEQEMEAALREVLAYLHAEIETPGPMRDAEAHKNLVAQINRALRRGQE